MNERHPHLEQLAQAADLPPGPREELLRHVDRCPACRARWLAEDPSRLFALLALEPVPPAVLDRLSRGTARAVDRPLARRRGRRRSLAAASLAASILLGLLLGGLLLPGRTPSPAVARLADESPPALVAEEAPPAAGIQLLASPSEARVVDLTVGGTQVVMIFDEDLDI